ncbi:MAG: DUF4831 family protein [Rikenellaceae bacterium]
MKHFILLFALAYTAVASAQNYTTAPLGVITHSDGSCELLEAPSSAIIVRFKLREVNFKPGVYARYAQKLLGVRASLIDSRSVEVLSSSLHIAPHDYFVAQPSHTPQEETKIQTTPTIELPIDRYSGTITPVELAAQEAAAQIFKIRATRRDLISGDIGEGVFGGGLNGVLEYFEKNEKELINLFMGERSIIEKSYEYIVNIEASKKQYILCRFDKTRGVLPAADLSAEPVYLQITPSKSRASEFPTPTEKDRTTRFRLANIASCSLYIGADETVTAHLPIFEFGESITVPVKK